MPGRSLAPRARSRTKAPQPARTRPGSVPQRRRAPRRKADPSPRGREGGGEPGYHFSFPRQSHSQFLPGRLDGACRSRRAPTPPLRPVSGRRRGPARAARPLGSAPLRAGGGRAGGSARPRLGPAPRCPAPPGASCWRRAAPGRAAAGPREAPFASAEREVRHGRVVRGRAGRDHGSRASVTASIRAARGQRARRDPAASGAGRQGRRAVSEMFGCKTDAQTGARGWVWRRVSLQKLTATSCEVRK